MSPPWRATDRARERGFTLLEIEVALVILTLAFLLLSRLGASHQVLLSDMDAWLAGEPTWYVVPRRDGYERQLLHAADLEDEAPWSGGALPVGALPPGAVDGGTLSFGDFGGAGTQVIVLSVTRTLEPVSVSALVRREAP